MTTEVQNERLQFIEPIMAEVMQIFNVPGVSIAVIQNNKVIYSKAFGFRDKEKLLPMSIDTLVGIGSTTKFITAAAIMILHERNLLNINDPVNKYVDFKLGSEEKPITIHHILSHSSGYPELFGSVIPLMEHLHSINSHVSIKTWTDWWKHLNGAKKALFEDFWEDIDNDLVRERYFLIKDAYRAWHVEENIRETLLNLEGYWRS